MGKLAPVALFVYNRLDHTIKTIKYLQNNNLAKETELFIFSDAAKGESQEENVKMVRKFISKAEGFKKVTVVYSEKNKGLAQSVIGGVTNILENHGKVIVLEDDILVSPFFLNFMNDALNFYEENEKIWSISGYKFPISIPYSYDKSVFFASRSSSWGWATWLDRWNTIDWEIKDYKNYKWNLRKIHHFCKGGTDLDKMLRHHMAGKIDSWAIRWCYNQAFQNRYTVYPTKSYVSNIGTDGSGTHCDPTSARFNVELDGQSFYNFENNVELNGLIQSNLKKVLDRSIIRKIKNQIRYYNMR
ncbi:sugar transferase [Metabacillus indicus]|uniref:sugar transferase n=1 Tax=Metabacillus indicus TaxID=246786 RepID=UPI0039842816